MSWIPELPGAPRFPVKSLAMLLALGVAAFTLETRLVWPLACTAAGLAGMGGSLVAGVGLVAAFVRSRRVTAWLALPLVALVFLVLFLVSAGILAMGLRAFP